MASRRGRRGRGCKVDSLKMGQADDNVAWSCFRTKAATATAEALKPPANAAAAAASTETAGWALLISHKVGQPEEREEGEEKRGHGEEREIERRGVQVRAGSLACALIAALQKFDLNNLYHALGKGAGYIG